MKNCVCLLAKKPSDYWIEFLSTFKKYDVYIVIDDNTIDYSSQYKQHKNINIIQIKEQECENQGFKNLSYCTYFNGYKPVDVWEKACYYFSNKNTTYDNVWFIEDDVYFYNEDVLLNIDKKYESSDLLANGKTYDINKDGFKSNWHWRKMDINLEPPYHCTMVFASRLSKSLLWYINDYAVSNNELFFSEASFPTLCLNYGLIYDKPPQLDTVIYSVDNVIYNGVITPKLDINRESLFHPVKDLNYMKKLKSILDKA